MHATSSLRTSLLVAALFLAVACSRQEGPASKGEAGAVAQDSAMQEMAPESTAPASAAARALAPAPRSVAAEAPPAGAQLVSSASTYTDAQRKFIRTAQARFRVADVYASALAIEDAVAANGGFVVRNDIESVDQRSRTWPQGDGTLLELTEYRVQGALTVRVPSERAQPFLRSIAKQMEFLDRRNFEAMDAQFALLRQQLAYQRHQQAQRALGDAADQGGRLGQKVSAIDARSGAQAARDEALVAQREFDDRVAFATLDLSIYQASRLRRLERVDLDAAARDGGPGFGARLAVAVRAGWRGMLDGLVEAARLWPLWLLGLFALLAYRRLRRA